MTVYTILAVAFGGCAEDPPRMSVRRLAELYPDHVSFGSEATNIRYRYQANDELVVSNAWQPPYSPHVPTVVQASGSDKAICTMFMIDTGSALPVAMGRGVAARLRVPIIDELAPGRGRLAGGVSEKKLGVAHLVEAASLRMSPAFVFITETGRLPALLGQPFVERLGALVLNPTEDEVIIMSSAAAAEARDRVSGATKCDGGSWVEVPWIQDEGSGLRVSPVRLGGRALTAVLDTGAQASVFAFIACNAMTGERIVSIRVGGVRRHVIESRLSEPLVLGPIRVEGAIVHRSTESSDDDEKPPADLIIGMDILSLAPVWFDPQEDVVRIWRGPCPPILPVRDR